MALSIAMYMYTVWHTFSTWIAKIIDKGQKLLVLPAPIQLCPNLQSIT